MPTYLLGADKMRLELPANNLSHPMICEHSSERLKLIGGFIHRQEGTCHTQCNSLFGPIPGTWVLGRSWVR